MKEQNLTEEERQATIDKWSRYIQETRDLAALGIHVNNARDCAFLRRKRTLKWLTDKDASVQGFLDGEERGTDSEPDEAAEMPACSFASETKNPNEDAELRAAIEAVVPHDPVGPGLLPRVWAAAHAAVPDLEAAALQVELVAFVLSFLERRGSFRKAGIVLKLVADQLAGFVERRRAASAVDQREAPPDPWPERKDPELGCRECRGDGIVLWTDADGHNWSAQCSCTYTDPATQARVREFIDERRRASAPAPAPVRTREQIEAEAAAERQKQAEMELADLERKADRLQAVIESPDFRDAEKPRNRQDFTRDEMEALVDVLKITRRDRYGNVNSTVVLNMASASFSSKREFMRSVMNEARSGRGCRGRGIGGRGRHPVG